MLDAVLEDGARLQGRLGAADKQRVEQHLEAVRAIERRLDAMPSGNPALCDDARRAHPRGGTNAVRRRPT